MTTKRAVLPTPNIPLTAPEWYQWFQGVDDAIKRFEALEEDFDALSDDFDTLAADPAITSLRAGILLLTDGVAAPAATAGKAKVYVDTADGDLKVKFADATTKTIETDT